MVKHEFKVGDAVYQPTVCRKMFDTLDNINNRSFPIEAYCFHIISTSGGKRCIEAIAPNIYHSLQENKEQQ